MDQTDMEDLHKILENDSDGMATYEYIVNHSDGSIDQMNVLVDNLRRVDKTGQFLASSARFLNAVNPEVYAPWLIPLIDGAIAVDRERRYIGSLLEAVWGPDYKERAAELSSTDDRFRRIYKRIYQTGPFGVNSDGVTSGCVLEEESTTEQIN